MGHTGSALRGWWGYSLLFQHSCLLCCCSQTPTLARHALGPGVHRQGQHLWVWIPPPQQLPATQLPSQQRCCTLFPSLGTVFPSTAMWHSALSSVFLVGTLRSVAVPVAEPPSWGSPPGALRSGSHSPGVPAGVGGSQLSSAGCSGGGECPGQC